MDDAILAERIMAFMKPGRSQAVLGPVIAEALGIDYRKVKRIIASMVASGAPIGSGAVGYFLLETVDEYERADRFLEHQIVSIARRRRGLRAAAHKRFGPLAWTEGPLLPMFDQCGRDAAEGGDDGDSGEA